MSEVTDSPKTGLVRLPTSRIQGTRPHALRYEFYSLPMGVLALIDTYLDGWTTRSYSSSTRESHVRLGRSQPRALKSALGSNPITSRHTATRVCVNLLALDT